jgi:hypothetical protein
LAKVKLRGYGIKIPDLDEQPPNCVLTEVEIEALSDYFTNTKDSSRLRRFSPAAMFFTYSGSRLSDSGLSITAELWTRFMERSASSMPAVGLNRMEKVLLSSNINGEQPFLSGINTSHLFRVSRDRQFGSLAAALETAQSLANAGIEFDHIPSLKDGGIIARFDDVPLTDHAASVVNRLFHALDNDRPISVWDLALTATVAKIEPQALSPVLDVLESWGGDVARCRGFLAFCATSDFRL